MPAPDLPKRRQSTAEDCTGAAASAAESDKAMCASVERERASREGVAWGRSAAAEKKKLPPRMERQPREPFGGLHQRQARRLAVIGAAPRYSQLAAFDNLLSLENPSRRDHCKIAAEQLSSRPSPGNDVKIIEAGLRSGDSVYPEFFHSQIKQHSRPIEPRCHQIL